MLHNRRFAADHHAVAALEAPDTSARPHVHIMDTLRRELLRAPDVVHVVRVAAVDDDVVLVEERQQIVDTRIHDGRRDHEPNRARFAELLYQLLERCRALRAFRHELRDRAGIAVVHDAGVAIA